MSKIYFWDKSEVASLSGAEVTLGKPEYRGKAVDLTNPWEGNNCGYYSVLRIGDKFRLYYGASSMEPCFKTQHTVATCVCESDDGITFSHPDIGHYEYLGDRHNNIVFMRERFTDNFCVMRDGNPDCPASEQFKALSQRGENIKDKRVFFLDLYVSADAYEFKFKCTLPFPGAFDSMNTFVYIGDGLYRIYYREVIDGKRYVKTCTTSDFITTSEPELLEYSDGNFFEMYTNGITRYDDIFVALPTRYVERCADAESVALLPDAENRKALIEKHGRAGTAMTDAMFMYSHDGVHFIRFPEAFYTPGAEGLRNWYYGNCYPSLGFAETAAPREGAAKELSFYTGENYRSTVPVSVDRYAVRRDGFACIKAGYSGGTVVTKEFIYNGALNLNFATSAPGAVKITLRGKDAVCESNTHFGDSVSRRITFAGDDALIGKPVCAEIRLSDASIYSMEV